MKIPDSYIAIDLETNDLPTKKTDGTPDFSAVHIVEFGFCVVQKRRATETIAKQFRLPANIEMSAGATKIHGHTRESLTKIGSDEGSGLRSLVSYFARRDLRNLPLVGHNISLFDLPVLKGAFYRHNLFGLSGSFLGRGVFDTLAIRRAGFWPLTLGDGERENEFATRVMTARRSSLDACLDFYEIKNNRETHAAGTDAYLAHKLFEALREDGTLSLVLGGLPWQTINEQRAHFGLAPIDEADLEEAKNERC